jgi:hypothetical protein
LIEVSFIKFFSGISSALLNGLLNPGILSLQNGDVGLTKTLALLELIDLVFEGILRTVKLNFRSYQAIKSDLGLVYEI